MQPQLSAKPPGKRQAGPHAPPDETVEGGPRLARIVVAEDEALIAFELQRLLVQFGYEVCALARSAPEAVQAAGAHEPDLVLMDIRLANNTDGVAAAQEIMDLFGIPAVYLTAHSDSATIARAQATRPLGLITKPFSATRLESALRDAIARLRQ